MFVKPKIINIREILNNTDLKLARDLNIKKFSNIASLDDAKKDDISFLLNKNHLKKLKTTKAKAIFTNEELFSYLAEDKQVFLARDAHKTLGDMINLFYPKEVQKTDISEFAIIAADCKIGKDVVIQAGVKIAKKVSIGDGSSISSGTVIAEGCTIGKNTKIGFNCSIQYTHIANGCIIESGVTIGNMGFAFSLKDKDLKLIRHVGGVCIEDDVFIGSLTNIDRGELNNTIISSGTRIGNNVHIAHNCKIGSKNIIVATSALAGSAVTEAGVVIAAQSGVAGNVRIGKNSIILARSGVSKNVDANSKMIGYPAVKYKNWLRMNFILKKIFKEFKNV